jgi:hypothetical protein
LTIEIAPPLIPIPNPAVNVAPVVSTNVMAVVPIVTAALLHVNWCPA